VCSSERKRGELRVEIELVPSSVAEEIEAEIDIKVGSILDSRCANHVNLCFIELIVFGMVGFRVWFI